MTRRQATIPGLSVPVPAGGPVYQGVARQIRAMFPKDDPEAKDRKAALSGWCSLALSHARAIDAAPMPSVGRAQTSSELREALAYLADAMSTGDGFDQFLRDLEEVGGGGSGTPAPYSPE